MPLIAKASSNGGGTFIPAPEGPHGAVCVDVIDYGLVESTWQGQTKQKHRIAIAFQLDEQTPDGAPFVVRWYGTLTLDERGKLRPFLENWRGKKFTADELADGFDVEKLIGAPALVQIVHATKGDATYANVDSIMKLPKGMAAPTPWSEYVRVKDRESQQPAAQRQAPPQYGAPSQPPAPDFENGGPFDDESDSLPF